MGGGTSSSRSSSRTRRRSAQRIARSMHWVGANCRTNATAGRSSPLRPADALTKLDVFIAEVQAAREQLATMRNSGRPVD